MIQDLTVELFGNPLVEAAVAGFHVEHGYLVAFGGDDGHTSIGVAVEHQCLRSYLTEEIVGL